MTKREVLQERRHQLLEQIARAADEIAEIDRRLAVLQSLELEADLIQAEPGER